MLGQVNSTTRRRMVCDETRVFFVTGIALHEEGGSPVIVIDTVWIDVPCTD